MKITLGGILSWLVVAFLIFTGINSYLIRKEMEKRNEYLQVIAKKLEEQNRILYNDWLSSFKTDTY
jgi:hypothetical protein